MKKALTRDAILAAEDLKRKDVPVPEWGGVVYIRSLNGVERDDFESEWRTQREKAGEGIRGLKAFILSICACDENGNQLFTKADVDALNEKSGAAIDRLWQVAERLNHFLPGDIKALAKNSESAPNDVSGSN